MSGSRTRLQSCGMEPYSAFVPKDHSKQGGGHQCLGETQGREGKFREPLEGALEMQGSVVNEGSLFWEASSE